MFTSPGERIFNSLENDYAVRNIDIFYFIFYAARSAAVYDISFKDLICWEGRYYRKPGLPNAETETDIAIPIMMMIIEHSIGLEKAHTTNITANT